MLKRLSELTTFGSRKIFGSRIVWFSLVRNKDLQLGIEKVEITIVHCENRMNGSCKNLLVSVRGFQLTVERGINLSEVNN